MELHDCSTMGYMDLVSSSCNTVPLSGAEDVKRREDISSFKEIKKTEGEFDHAEL